VVDLRELARQHTEAAIAALADALHSADDMARVDAAKELLARAYGPPGAAMRAAELEERRARKATS
jgi:hypothetical protein